MDRINTLAATQRALLERIQALDQQEAEEQAAIEEIEPDDNEQVVDEQDVLAMLLNKQQELQRMRSAISELQQLQTGVQDLLSGRPAQVTFGSSTAETDAEQFEQDFLEGLLRKRSELQRMQAALAGLSASVIVEEVDEEAEDDAPATAPEPAPAAAVSTGAQEEEQQAKQDMLAMLTAKHDELTRMRAAILELQELQTDMQAADEEDDEEDAAQEDEDEEEEPRTEQEWLEKLMKQQAELRQLRAAIASAEAGAPPSAANGGGYGEQEEDDDDEQAKDMLRALAQKREELQSLLFAKANLERQLAEEQGKEQNSIPAPPPAPAPRDADERELLAILERRRAAQQAVDEQERKIAELTALQESLRNRLLLIERQGFDNNGDGPQGPDLENEDEEEEVDANEGEGREEEEEDEEEDEEEEGAPEAGIQERVLRLLAVKTQQCDELAEYIETAREAGVDPRDERLVQAERELSQRYGEVKDIAAIAKRLGMSSAEQEEEQAADEPDEEAEVRTYELTPSAEAALIEVHRLEHELRSCLSMLQQVEAQSSPAVMQHPAYVQMRTEVQKQLEGLQSQLDEARAVYEHEMRCAAAAAQQQQEKEDESEALDLGLMLQDSVNRLWARPYECRVFTLQLLNSLAELDDRSLSMMCSCFSRYLDEHAVPVP